MGKPAALLLRARRLLDIRDAAFQTGTQLVGRRFADIERPQRFFRFLRTELAADLRPPFGEFAIERVPALIVLPLRAAGQRFLGRIRRCGLFHPAFRLRMAEAGRRGRLLAGGKLPGVDGRQLLHEIERSPIMFQRLRMLRVIGRFHRIKVLRPARQGGFGRRGSLPEQKLCRRPSLGFYRTRAFVAISGLYRLQQPFRGSFRSCLQRRQLELKLPVPDA